MCLTFGNPSDPCCERPASQPAYGFIQRFIYPEPIADDLGIATAQWSYGVTGNVVEDNNRTCFYWHFTTPNKRTTSVFEILQPIRWSIETPSEDGSSWDHWTDLTVGGTHPDYHSGQLTNTGFGSIGLREKLIPRDWHCRFQDNVVHVGFPVQPRACNRDFDQIEITNQESYQERALQSIAPDVPPWDVDGNSDTYPVTSSVYAFRHVVDGVPGALFFTAEIEEGDYWKVRVAPHQTYQIDVWYRIGINASQNFSPSPGKGCCYFPLRRVSNGSRGALGCGYLVSFFNVDYSPRFTPEKQTYEITLGGHRGWTLRNGSNGPHRLSPESDWNADSGNGVATVATADPSSFWATIQLNFAREIPQVLFAPGPAMRALHPQIGKAILYRSIDNPGLYRKYTNSADFGSVTHAFSGRFLQDDTTVFHLVPWTVEGGVASDPSPYITNLGQGADGRFDSSDSPPVYSSVPKTITLTRVSK